MVDGLRLWHPRPVNLSNFQSDCPWQDGDRRLPGPMQGGPKGETSVWAAMVFAVSLRVWTATAGPAAHLACLALNRQCGLSSTFRTYVCGARCEAHCMEAKQCATALLLVRTPASLSRCGKGPPLPCCHATRRHLSVTPGQVMHNFRPTAGRQTGALGPRTRGRGNQQQRAGPTARGCVPGGT
jgi:hypothetical protein